MIELLVWPVSLGLIAIGLFGALAPRVASRLFGLSAAAPSWVVAAGVRDISLGLALLFVRLHGSRLLVGEVCLAMTVIPLSDAWITYRAGARIHALAHLGGGVAIACYGLMLIVWGG
jgi:hypothetical protein